MAFSHKCIQTVHAAFVNDAELWVVVDYMDKVCACACARARLRAALLFFIPPLPPPKGSLADVMPQLTRCGQVMDERFVFHVASQLLNAM